MFMRLHSNGARVALGLLVGLLLPAIFWSCGDGGDSNNAGTVPAATGSAGMVVHQTNLVSDQPNQATTTDPNLVNAWGIAQGPTTAFWIADNGQGVSTLYNGTGQPFPVDGPLVVTIPPPAGSPPDAGAAPTGTVFNSTTDFVITAGTQSGPSTFIFATEDGTLSGWNRDVDPTAAILAVDNSGANAVYKGLALGSNATGNFLYATNFHAARVEAFDKNFAPASLSGSFSDPEIPAGFAPFGIANIGNSLYVTYAKQDDQMHDDAAGAGNGFVDIFDTNGVFVRRFASQGTLNSPWGVVRTPSGFGTLGNLILVGDFGDGHINAFDPSSGKFLGQLSDGHSPIAIDGLWGLIFGNGGNAGDANTLFFTAGPDMEMHGLFGMLQPGTTSM